MHEGKHGILDDVEDMDDVFGTKEDSDGVCEHCKAHKHDNDDDNKHDHDHDHKHNH